MKKRLVAGIMAVVMTMTCLVSFGSVEVKAANSYTLPDAYIHDGNGNQEIAVGDGIELEMGALYKNGAAMNPVDYDVENRYGKYYNPNTDTLEDLPDVYFDTFELPESMFGMQPAIRVELKIAGEEEHQYVDVISPYRITYWAADEYTVDVKSENTVRVYSIWKGSNLSVKDKVTVNNVEYTVDEIGSYAVDGDAYTTLKSVTLPSSVKYIGEKAFFKAKSLKNITIKGNLKSIGKNAFAKINSKAVFEIKANKKNFNKMVKMIKKAGAPKKATFKRINISKK